jgi:hypothetical protein
VIQSAIGDRQSENLQVWEKRFPVAAFGLNLVRCHQTALGLSLFDYLREMRCYALPIASMLEIRSVGFLSGSSQAL